MAEKPFVSIVIPTFRDSVRLQKCLTALACQSYPQESFEILVVDNDPEGTLDAELEFVPANARLLRQPRPGSYAARNRGLADARGEIIGFTDSDCLPEELWIEVAVNGFVAEGAVPRVGGAIRVFAESEQSPTPAECYDRYFAFPQEEYIRKRGACTTANMFSRREVFDAVGLFNDAMFSGGDMEWGQRAAKAGYPIRYVPGAIVLHPARKTYADLRVKAKRIGGGLFTPGVFGFVLAHIMLLWALVPPFDRAARVLWRRGPIGCKIKAVAIHYALKLIRARARVAAAWGRPRSRQ